MQIPLNLQSLTSSSERDKRISYEGNTFSKTIRCQFLLANVTLYDVAKSNCVITKKVTMRSIVCEASCHHVIVSQCHSVIVSPCHHVIVSLCHHVILRSAGHHVIILFNIATDTHTLVDNIRGYRSASQTTRTII